LEDWKVIHEVKKSRKVDIAAKWQLKYYIWTLRNKGINIEKGVLDYPILRKREEVFLNRQEEEELLCVLDDIRNTINLDKPPETANKRICKKCSYYELCYV
jgi:CRISPR-associated exonuclease Cas4